MSPEIFMTVQMQPKQQDKVERPAASQAAVLHALSRPAAYRRVDLGPVHRVQRIDTHISAVFLAGDRAFKLKRDVAKTFLDYSSLDKRRHNCFRELALNQVVAPELYVGVRPVLWFGGAVALGDLVTQEEDFPKGPEVLDAVVEMRRFSQDSELDQLAAADGITPDLVEDLAREVARAHQASVPVFDRGGAESFRRTIRGNADSLHPFVPDVFDVDTLEAMHDACMAALERHASLADSRRSLGKVRRCHGDLHLRNICLLNNKPVLFDAIEFNEAYACIDVLYDLAFLLMDLEAWGLRRHASTLLNTYLDWTGEHEGLPLLPLMLALRAVIRAHVTAASALQQHSAMQADHLRRDAQNYMALAQIYLRPVPPRLVALGGVQGTGKSRLSRVLAPDLGIAPGAIVLRTDTVRKLMHGMAPTDRLPPEAYSADAAHRVHQRLESLAAKLLAAGHSVITDGVFGKPGERDRLEHLAVEHGAAFTGLWLEADPAVLEARVAAREAAGNDASDAGVEVLRATLARDPGPIHWHRVDAGGGKAHTEAQARAIVATAAQPRGGKEP